MEVEEAFSSMWIPYWGRLTGFLTCARFINAPYRGHLECQIDGDGDGCFVRRVCFLSQRVTRKTLENAIRVLRQSWSEGSREPAEEAPERSVVLVGRGDV